MSGRIGIARYQEIFRRLLRVPAAADLVPTLASELVPTLDVTDPPMHIASLGGVLPCMHTQYVAAVAGQYSRIHFTPAPSNSNVLTRIRGFAYIGDGAQTVRIGRTTTAAGALTTGVPRDGRFAVNRVVGSLSGGTAAGRVLAAGFIYYGFVASATNWIELEFVIPPGGDGLSVEGDVVNTPLRVSLLWDELTINVGNYELEGL
jgi:hypothetical protein